MIDIINLLIFERTGLADFRRAKYDDPDRTLGSHRAAAYSLLTAKSVPYSFGTFPTSVSSAEVMAKFPMTTQPTTGSQWYLKRFVRQIGFGSFRASCAHPFFEKAMDLLIFLLLILTTELNKSTISIYEL